MSIPGGYETATDGLIPRFFGYTTHCDLDVVDFQLEKRPNDNFTLFISTDTHLRGDPEELDLPQFRKWYLPDISREIKHTKGPVYSLHLGDMTTDIMWHKNDFALRKYLDVMKTYPSPIFHIPGNHDNERFVDPAVPMRNGTASHSALTGQIIGPNYYSFNLGKVHFVMLDNIIVRKGRSKTAGARPATTTNSTSASSAGWAATWKPSTAALRSSSACTYLSPTGQAWVVTAPLNSRPKRANGSCTTRSCRYWHGSTTCAS